MKISKPTTTGENKISFEIIAKLYLSPEQFKLDCAKIASDIKVFSIKYGDLGLQVVSDLLTKI